MYLPAMGQEGLFYMYFFKWSGGKSNQEKENVLRRVEIGNSNVGVR